ncbi:T9SS type A sorting domain-containing protein [Paraflavitalea pollutisoli]|uniref:T9SS type A sorting domain-containing protein n=1 Tax=Paraflavitalea pollutisoli TaxID=3034143 RepID=UPI0023EDF9D2|nr:T9SS type A sorting domain-containing protein [Paraflavitalea sp. H1-2-19X]
MKRFITLFLLTVFVQQWTMAAAAPTVPTSNLTWKDHDGSRLNGSFTAGNGRGRIVVMKEGSPVTGLPVNGVDYQSHFNFGTAGTAFTGPGEFVISKTSFTTFNADKLKPGTTYYVAIFEYDGTGAGITYLMLPLEGNQATVVAPATPTTSVVKTTSTGNTMILSWTKGNGSGRIVFARKGAAVNLAPTDLTNYGAEADFGAGSKIGADHYVVYKGTAAGCTIKNLEPNTTYHFSVFEYNGVSFPVYLNPGTAGSGVTNQGPNTAPTGIGFSYVEGDEYRVSVSVGNGNRRLFIAKKESAVTAVPVNGVVYSSNNTFGNGTEIAPGEFVFGSTSNNYADLIGLEPNTTYHIRVYEYDVDAAGTPYYLTSSSAIRSGSTATTPTKVCSNIKLNSLSGGTASIGFTNGDGAYRVVIMKAGSAVDAVPANLTRYTGNANFGSGAQVAPGNYVIHGGMNGSSFTVNNLLPGVTYHLAIYEFNGNNHAVYSSTGATFNFVVPAQPANPSTAPTVLWNEGKTFRLGWTNGGGSHRLVIAKKGSAVTAKPVDGAAYTANNKFSLGQELATGEYVVFNGTANYVELDALEMASTYHFAVFDYNLAADGTPDYLVSSFLTHNGSTVTWPTTPAVITSVSGIQATTANINITKGNGAYRLVVMKKGAAVNVLPQDLIKYTYSTTFGAAAALMSDGNYAIYIPSGSGVVNVYGLEANTTYHVACFEMNGYESPAYLRASPGTYSFTTTDVPGATVPTAPASNAVVESRDGNKFGFKWTAGDGEKRIVVMKQGSAVTFVPSPGVSYAANTVFGAGTDLGGGQYIVHSSALNTVEVTGLQPAATYHYTIFEFNGTGTLIRYLTSSVLNGTIATVAAPATPPATPITTPGATSMALNWTNGNGAGRLVIMKEGGVVTATPAMLSVYPANAAFKSGSQVAAGEYVVYAGTGNTVLVTGLQANKTYHYSIFEYNGSAAPVYNPTAVQGFATLSGTLPVSLLFFKAQETNGDVLLTWATAQESNNATFTIEKSTDGNTFTTVTTLAGAGNSDHRIDYNYTEQRGATVKTWYRLKQTDLDGRITWSNLVVVQPSVASRGINLYPNPVQGALRVEWPVSAQQARAVVYNAAGMVVLQEKLAIGRTLSCAGLKPGTYYLTLQAGGQQFRSSFIKQ